MADRKMADRKMADRKMDGAVFRIHAHVISADSPEPEGRRSFRDRLRADQKLSAHYSEVSLGAADISCSFVPKGGIMPSKDKKPYRASGINYDCDQRKQRNGLRSKANDSPRER